MDARGLSVFSRYATRIAGIIPNPNINLAMASKVIGSQRGAHGCASSTGGLQGLPSGVASARIRFHGGLR